MNVQVKIETFMNAWIYSMIGNIRRKTRLVNIGNVQLGGDNPIRVQSMTTTDTMDTIATVEQSIRLIKAGSEYVRITTPSRKEAENLAKIKEEITKRGYNTPIIADVHYTPKVAEIAAQIVEKVRINPGNYSDKNTDKKKYSESEYQSELHRINERLAPLIETCKKHQTAMRIGVNHGSLSNRIMSCYGDTPKGMVESAMEFVKICHYLDYHDIVLSMKASNPLIMIEANRLLTKVMDEQKMDYPIHLGVTEAGEGEDARIKSTIGIGTLLNEGIGDTIRVSLTEEPEAEIPVARKIIESTNPTQSQHNVVPQENNLTEVAKTKLISDVPIVVADFRETKLNLSGMHQIGYEYSHETKKFRKRDIAVDWVYLGSREPFANIPNNLNLLYDFDHWRNIDNKSNCSPLLNWNEFEYNINSNFTKFVKVGLSEADIDTLKLSKNTVLVIDVNKEKKQEIVDFTQNICEFNIEIPIVLFGEYNGLNEEQLIIKNSLDFGSLLIDNIGNGIWIKPSNRKSINTAFGILQATRKRITKTEYISCPSCGRTLFNIQKVSKEIRNRTSHLKGLKIGIIGCIVNGIGEMADADYGYVGTGNNRISLYRGHSVVKKNIPSDEAVNSLIELIRCDGKWIDI